MAHEEQRQPGENPIGDEVPAAEPAADTAGSAPEEGLTVDDILGTKQNEDAVVADSADATPGENVSGDPKDFYLEDLRRITAEYANYRKRTEANAAIEKRRLTAAVVSPLLTVLDDFDRAEAHGDLKEGSAFVTIAHKLRGALERFGVESFGEVGDPFDPQVHEAVAQVPVPGTEQQTVLDVIERGYRLGDVELRPAKVAVAVAADG